MFNVVGKIEPPEYKDPVKMLRNLADDIEAGKFGEVDTVAIAMATDQSYEMFGGGRASGMEHCAFAFATAASRLHGLPWTGE